jgi:hypothetical protein
MFHFWKRGKDREKDNEKDSEIERKTEKIEGNNDVDI